LYVAGDAAGRRQTFSDATLARRLACPGIAEAPAVDLTPEQTLDTLSSLIDAGKRRTADKLRANIRAACQCALDVRTTPSLPVVFKSFGVVFASATHASIAALRPRRQATFSKADLQTYWKLVADRRGVEAAIPRLHLVTGGQRTEQFARLMGAGVSDEAPTIIDGKGRPSQGPRPTRFHW
jgi:hypothetical protein